MWFWQLSTQPHTNGLHNWQASVNIRARSNVTLDIALHVVGVQTVGVRTLRHNQTFLPMVRALSTQELRYITNAKNKPFQCWIPKTSVSRKRDTRVKIGCVWLRWRIPARQDCETPSGTHWFLIWLEWRPERTMLLNSIQCQSTMPYKVRLSGWCRTKKKIKVQWIQGSVWWCGHCIKRKEKLQEWSSDSVVAGSLELLNHPAAIQWNATNDPSKSKRYKVASKTLKRG